MIRAQVEGNPPARRHARIERECGADRTRDAGQIGRDAQGGGLADLHVVVMVQLPVGQLARARRVDQHQQKQHPRRHRHHQPRGRRDQRHRERQRRSECDNPRGAGGGEQGGHDGPRAR